MLTLTLICLILALSPRFCFGSISGFTLSLPFQRPASHYPAFRS